MPLTWTLNLNDGRTWFVGAEHIYREPDQYPNFNSPKQGEVIIPVCQLDGLTTEQIGEYVLSAATHARGCHAVAVADRYQPAEHIGYYDLTDEQLQSLIFEDLPLLESYVGSECIDPIKLQVAIDFLQLLRAKHLNPKTKRQVRQTVSNNYEKLFIAIGRRDGFHCGACRSTYGLVIDHIIPVSMDGTSDQSNLQLLCSSCNNQKGTRTVDYRSPTMETVA